LQKKYGIKRSFSWKWLMTGDERCTYTDYLLITYSVLRTYVNFTRLAQTLNMLCGSYTAVR